MRWKSLILMAGLMAAGCLFASAPSEATGRGARAADAQRLTRAPARPRAMRSLPRRTAVNRAGVNRPAASRAAATRSAATRTARRPVSVATRNQPATRVAGFAQRATPRATPRPAANVARAFNVPGATSDPSNFVNGYRDLSFTQFRTGDFFSHPQINSGQ